MNYQDSAQLECEKCNSINWDVNKQGNQTCKNCGFISSLGYITYENEVFDNLEDDKPKQNRVIYSDGQLFIKNIYVDYSSKKSNSSQSCNEQALTLFDKCMKVFQDFFQMDRKDVYIQKQDFIQILKEQEDNLKKSNIKDFIFHYFLNSLSGIELNQQKQLKEQLKSILGIKIEKEKRAFNLSNSLTCEEKFQKLMLNLKHDITDDQLVFCELRLEEIRNHKDISCKQNSLFCLVAFDLLSNYFGVKKVDLKNISQTTQQVLDTKCAEISESTIKKLYKKIENKQFKKSEFSI